MPELPEVQTVVTDLNKKIKGYKIVDFWSAWPKTIKSHPVNRFKKEIVGEKIIKVWRLGKNIFIDLTNNKTIYIHLMMTGHLLIKDKKIPDSKFFKERVNQYIHHKWILNKGLSMEFSDVRKFAKIVLVDADKVKELKEVKELGIDLIDKGFTLNKFKEVLDKRKNKAIGLVLMDQNLLAGIGNIYRSEILYEAKILPLRLSGKLNDKEIELLYKTIIRILKKAIKLRGTSDSDYRDTYGKQGQYQKVLKVYRKNGDKCFGCSGKIERIKMAQRAVFYCKKCQK
jgi:formamidopyrimidine-DNA glycosylase